MRWLTRHPHLRSYQLLVTCYQQQSLEAGSWMQEAARADEDIVHPISNNRSRYDVGSP